MSITNPILLTPVLDLQGAWGGIWIQGTAEETAAVRDRLAEQVPQLHILLDTGSPLAAGIKDMQQLTQAKAQGATWFAGPYVAHPTPVSGSAQDAGKANLMRLMSLVAQDADADEIGAVFKHDPGLSFHLFRLVNSPGMGLSRKISSFNEAILVLGRRQLQRWVQLLLYASKKQDASSPLLAFAAMRGRMLEKLAHARGRDAEICEQAFMTGIFSLLDSLLGMPMADIARAVQLPEPVQQALLTQQGELGEFLCWVGGAQSGSATDLPDGVSAEQCLEIQLDAVSWAANVGAEMG